MFKISTDTSLNCILPSIKHTIDTWNRLLKENSLCHEEKEIILKKITEIQNILNS